MIYSPAVTVFRSDDGGWIEPYKIDVVTSPAVNAGVVRRGAGANVEGEIARVTKERMSGVLYLFEQSSVRDLVLGSFRTGVFRNDVWVVARLDGYSCRRWRGVQGFIRSRRLCYPRLGDLRRVPKDFQGRPQRYLNCHGHFSSSPSSRVYPWLHTGLVGRNMTLTLTLRPWLLGSFLVM
ncbi:hypothetical protein HETIRDRAFT_482600 [Heterobasidion irregulare TC 32-1]|uniref:Uncharacterized protein n=1 Tax=Heterobasidion irregulare (strain TC 32-1) TaxID=747525 RepID=W4JP13_HETIT|nr:uncharacterized protein HETIRDRAFT_482600 [Heterobasidion irregulare TC 32-1]ETW74805.1 hypothetical protein HETIRDRAFT_482600 [Heterobasidion irregulare TC 32-1]